MRVRCKGVASLAERGVKDNRLSRGETHLPHPNTAVTILIMGNHIKIKKLYRATAERGTDMTEALKTAFTTATTQMQTDVVGMLEVALPAGLAIFGIGFAIRKGLGFFKSIA